MGYAVPGKCFFAGSEFVSLGLLIPSDLVKGKSRDLNIPTQMPVLVLGFAHSRLRFAR
jgi:hypothetical protein